MQITKDDVKKTIDMVSGNIVEGIDFSKFQQVVEFYEKYKNDFGQLQIHYPEIAKKYFNIYTGTPTLENWLFSYCFVEGLE